MKRYVRAYAPDVYPNRGDSFRKSTGTYSNELLDHYRVTNYKGYDIIRLLYGTADYGDSGDEYSTSDEYEVYTVGYDKNAPRFDTLEDAKRYIDNNIL